MSSFFSIIKFVPNAIANETINVGVLFASGDRVEVHPLSDWHRVKAFAGTQWRDVRRLVQDMHTNPSAFIKTGNIATAEELRPQLQGWTHLIQFSEIRASIVPFEELVQTILPMVLSEASARTSTESRRAAVIKAAYQAAVSAFELRFERQPRGIVKKNAVVSGRRTAHKIDIGIVNGQVYGGAFALSFATSHIEKQWKDTDAVAFAVDDLPVDRSLLTVILDAPLQPSEPYERAQALFNQMRVPTLEFSAISNWANRAIAAVPDSIGQH